LDGTYHDLRARLFRRCVLMVVVCMLLMLSHSYLLRVIPSPLGGDTKGVYPNHVEP
jgi:hypothetical protein